MLRSRVKKGYSGSLRRDDWKFQHPAFLLRVGVGSF